MSNASPLYDDRFVDLLTQRSTTGLSEADQQEFNSLSQSPKHESEMERYDLTVAALDLALGSGDRESMPRDIQDRVLLAAGSFFRGGSDASPSATTVNENRDLSPRRAASRFSFREAFALAVMAACLMLVLNAFVTQRGLKTELADSQRISQHKQENLEGLENKLQDLTTQLIDLQKEKEIVIVESLTADQKMQQFIDSKPADLVQVNWKQNAAGQVVWSDSLQEGYMEFTGLPKNNPTVEQYQLWIFDTDKGQDVPVDGGVFDIGSTGEVVIPIKAHCLVEKAVQFAITIEKPGGVMKSDRKRLPLLASVDE